MLSWQGVGVVNSTQGGGFCHGWTDNRTNDIVEWLVESSLQSSKARLKTCTEERIVLQNAENNYTESICREWIRHFTIVFPLRRFLLSSPFLCVTSGARTLSRHPCNRCCNPFCRGLTNFRWLPAKWDRWGSCSDTNVQGTWRHFFPAVCVTNVNVLINLENEAEYLQEAQLYKWALYETSRFLLALVRKKNP